MSDDFVTIEFNGRTFTDIVPKWSFMEPETERLVYGDALQDGMRVIAQNRQRGSEVEPQLNGIVLITNNRWCTVREIRKFVSPKDSDDSEKPKGKKIHSSATFHTFIAVYDDGLELLRTTRDSDAWVVKRIVKNPIES